MAVTVASALAVVALMGAPAMATKKKPSVSCKEIKDAVASGKSADDVAKDMNVSASRVKSCTTPSTKHHKSSTKKAS
jgi:hypothetical protein